MTTYEKIVKGATKIKVAAPKPKYIEPILLATSSRSELKSVMGPLYNRLQDSAWSIVFKALLVIHIMMREGEKEVTLRYLSNHLDFFEISTIKKLQGPESRQLVRYAKYLAQRTKQFNATGVDYVRDEQQQSGGARSLTGSSKTGRLRILSVDKGLLREVESVERQISSLLHCRFSEAEINNDIVLTCFRMLVNDLLCLYQALNEGVINILEHYFEMSRFDAERALAIYKEFVELTTEVVNYLRVAKHLEYSTKLHVPTIKHAPTALAHSLEEYLHDANFEVNRSQYLAEKEIKDNTGAKDRTLDNGPSAQQLQEQEQKQQPLQQQTTAANPWQTQISSQIALQPLQLQPMQTNGGIIVQQQAQQPLIQQPTSNPFVQQQATAVPQATGFVTAPFQPQSIQSSNTGFNPALNNQTTGQPLQTRQTLLFTGNQPQQQQQQLQLHQEQTPLQSYNTGSFSSVPNATLNPAFTGVGFGGYTSNNSTNSSNKAASNALVKQATGNNPFSLDYQSQSDSIAQQQQQQQLKPVRTGSNPFALDYKSPAQLSSIVEKSSSIPISTTGTQPLQSQVTGTNPFLKQQPTGTNPFQKQYTSNRISINGSIQSATFGGYENLPTQPVFPQTIQQQHTNQYQQQASVELQNQINYNRQQQEQQQQQLLQANNTGYGFQNPVQYIQNEGPNLI